MRRDVPSRHHLLDEAHVAIRGPGPAHPVPLNLRELPLHELRGHPGLRHHRDLPAPVPVRPLVAQDGEELLRRELADDPDLRDRVVLVARGVPVARRDGRDDLEVPERPLQVPRPGEAPPRVKAHVESLLSDLRVAVNRVRLPDLELEAVVPAEVLVGQLVCRAR